MRSGQDPANTRRGIHIGFPPIPSSVKAKANIDAAFLQQFRAILSRIAFPHLKSKETLIVFSHSCFLILRTLLSIAVAKLDGVIVRDLVSVGVY